MEQQELFVKIVESISELLNNTEFYKNAQKYLNGYEFNEVQDMEYRELSDNRRNKWYDSRFGCERPRVQSPVKPKSCGVVAITSASHAEGPGFEPQ
ncbi:hypothetical protein BB559_001259 [Furculomyces boomerangus]|uniref:Uncharacterized protein n=2 Tax=Harpellales TaxID=61421 RepID=A0A2T9Z2P7_9FUNG|nr:hypothetical protein BB559_001259 [Furculomyces boomerangus]PWA01885.1 hypothetical protein BB558_002015 [Smittium angustum]